MSSSYKICGLPRLCDGLSDDFYTLVDLLRHGEAALGELLPDERNPVPGLRHHQAAGAEMTHSRGPGHAIQLLLQHRVARVDVDTEREDEGAFPF